MRHNILKRCFAWFGIFLLLVVTFLVPYFSQKAAYAVELNYQAAADNIRAAGRIQRIVNVAKHCTNGDVSYRKVSGDIDDLLDGSSYWLNDMQNMAAGPWLEDEVQDHVEDGEIYCQNGPNNILEVFATYLGYDLAKEIACNGDKPGLLTAYVNGASTSDACSSLIGQPGYSFRWRTNDDSLAHLKYLYEKYKTDHPQIGQYLPIWGKVGEFTDQAIAYYVYYDDWFWACAGGEYYEGNADIMPKDVYWGSVRILNEKTGEFDVKRNYIKEGTAQGSDGFKWDSSVVGDSAGARNCSDVRKKLNDYADAASKKVIEGAEKALKQAQEAAKANCKEIATETGYDNDKNMTVFAQLDLAKKIIADPEVARATLVEKHPDASDEELDEAVAKVVERAKQVQTELDALIVSGIYWEEGTGEQEGEIICKTWPTVYNGDITPNSGFTAEYTEFVEEGDPKKEMGDSEYCYSAGLDSMAWIMCPATTNMSSAVKGISGLIDGMLSTDTELYNNDSGTKMAWEIFRNIANSLIIIILMVIIFSQLTGVGIDNYGIKRMLPRLILMAVLINLSFIICQVAVDLSNVLGRGLNTLFSSIGQTIMDNNGVDPAERTFSWIITGLLAATAGVSAGAGMVITAASASGGGAMIIICLILALLVALVAVLMFFVMLGARFVIIIMFMSIAPLAFACYILPNTQGLFKKWWSIFKTALVIYPICGALYGISDIIKAVIWSDGNGVHLFMGIIAVCAPFIPFLVIPALLKGALGALGVIGGAIGALGNGLRNGLSMGQKGLQSTQAYKQAQERAQRHQANRWANRNSGLFKNGNAKWDNQGFLLNEDGTRRVNKNGKEIKMSDRKMARKTAIAANARAQLLKEQERADAEKNITSSAGYAASVAEQRAKAAKNMAAAYQSQLNGGQATLSDGTKVNISDIGKRETGYNGTMARYYKEATARYNAATEGSEERAQARAQMTAAQNLMASSDGGRTAINAMLDAERNTAAGQAMAENLLDQHNDLFKSKHRSAYELAKGITSVNGAGDKNYAIEGIGDLSPERIAGADDGYLREITRQIETGSLDGASLEQIRGYINDAKTYKGQGKLDIQGDKEVLLDAILKARPGSFNVPHNGDTSTHG
ncbi:MAG: hypothetical protein Q4B29_02060 [Candidatus Saccharibacteria bacterium]|nr:hypothetical protein [Candidatus Saccharibacteria bacterium]